MSDSHESYVFDVRRPLDTLDATDVRGIYDAQPDQLVGWIKDAQARHIGESAGFLIGILAARCTEQPPTVNSLACVDALRQILPAVQLEQATDIDTGRTSETNHLAPSRNTWASGWVANS